MSSTGGASSVAIAPSRRRAYRGGARRVPIGRRVVAGSNACAVEVEREVSPFAIGRETRRVAHKTRSRALGVARSETRGVDGHLTLLARFPRSFDTFFVEEADVVDDRKTSTRHAPSLSGPAARLGSRARHIRARRPP